MSESEWEDILDDAWGQLKKLPSVICARHCANIERDSNLSQARKYAMQAALFDVEFLQGG